jgi:hypothetical protein
MYGHKMREDNPEDQRGEQQSSQIIQELEDAEMGDVKDEDVEKLLEAELGGLR